MVEEPIKSIILEARAKFIDYYGPTLGQIQYDRFVAKLSALDLPRRRAYSLDLLANVATGGYESSTKFH